MPDARRTTETLYISNRPAVLRMHRHPLLDGSEPFSVYVGEVQDLCSAPRRRIRVSGKGHDISSSRRSCLYEAVERYCCTYGGPLTGGQRATIAELPNKVHPADIMLFSESQYEASHQEQADPRYHIPAPPLKDLPQPWIEARSLLEGRTTFVPAASCYLDFPDRQLGLACSSGCASGASFEAAATAALLELIERDAAGIWWYNRIQRPSIDLKSQSCSADIVKFFEKRGRLCWMFDITTDINLPVYAALSMNIRDEPKVAIGFGADLVPDRASAKAILEMAQCWIGIESLFEKSRFSCEIWDLRSVDLVRDFQFLLPSRASEPSRTPITMDQLISDLRAQGLEAWLVDMKNPEISIPVVRAFVPGLRHFWPRFGPGRLYDVPIKKQWRDHPTPETHLTRMSLPL